MKPEPKAIPCQCSCFGGMRGNQTCHCCDGTGSQFVANGKYFPNTKEGWDKAVKELQKEPEHD